MRKVILEVRCNEYEMRDRNPNVPWSPEEIGADAAACREAGASMLHYHARHPETGEVSHDLELYADTIRRVRAASDLLVMPTLGAYTIPDPRERAAHIPKLAADPATRPDLAPVDLASTNVDPWIPGKGFLMEDVVYINTIEGIRAEMEMIAGSGVGLDAVLWNVGSARILGALIEDGLWPEPAFTELVLANELLSVLPASELGLRTLHQFLPEGRDLVWTGLCPGSLFEMLELILELGGHLAFGLGDNPFLELGTPTNAQVVAEVAKRVRGLGYEIATPAEARQMLGLGS